MKKILLFLLVVLCLQSARAQLIELNDDTLIHPQYDTVVLFHHPDYQACSNMNVWDYAYCLWPFFASGTIEEYYSCLINDTKPSYSYYDSSGAFTTYYPQDLAGSFFGKNSYLVEAYAQPFHLDSSVTIIGVAAQVRGYIFDASKKIYVTTEKHGFEPLVSTVVYPANLQEGNTMNSMGHYFFYDPITVKDFFIVGETYMNPSDTAYRWWPNYSLPDPRLDYNATYSIFDTIWKDTIVGCQATHSPWFKKNGQWIRFSDDTVYSIVQNSTLNFNPIVILHSTSSSLDEATLEQTCSIFPNPAETFVTVRSNYKAIRYDLYDEGGKKILGNDCNAYEFIVDMRQCVAGYYTLRIKTAKGEFTKKIIKN